MTIQEVAQDIGLDELMARFLVDEFSLPMDGDELLPEGVQNLRVLKYLLFEEGYTLKGARRVLPGFLARVSDPSGTVKHLEERLQRYSNGIRDALRDVDELASLVDQYLKK